MDGGNSIDAILTDLDTLLDTRLGTIAKIDESIAKQVLESGTYHDRVADVFPGITKEQFQEAYRARDIVTLSMSTISNAMLVLRDLVKNINIDAVKRPYTSGTKLYVNLHPYKLEPETKGYLKAAIEHWIPAELAPVEFLDLSIHELKPTLILQLGISAMMLYEYNDWMNAQVDDFTSMPIPKLSKVQFFVPLIYQEKVPSEREMKELMQNIGHPAQALEMQASPLVGLQVLSAKYFSVINQPVV